MDVVQGATSGEMGKRKSGEESVSGNGQPTDIILLQFLFCRQ